MSTRTTAGEIKYQADKEAGKTIPLELEPAIRKWDHWRLIDNRYPYDVAFKTHHMLLPKRAGISDRWHLNDLEKQELEHIIKDFVYEEYDLWFENCPKRRSVARVYHLHLATYKDSREEMSL